MIMLHPNSNEQKQVNIEHLNNPKVGDYWHEMFVPACVVVSVIENEKKVLICTAKQEIDEEHWTFDLAQLKTVTFKEFKDELTYNNDPDSKTWCDVIPECHKWVKDEAKKIMFGD